MSQDEPIPPGATFELLRDITAAELAIDSHEPGEGYPPDHVIGMKGSTVRLAEDAQWFDDQVVEVTGFSYDPSIIGLVLVEDLKLIGETT